MNSAERNRYLRSARVVRKLPHRLYRRERLPKGLIGAEILDIGTVEDAGMVEGGGLVIDFLPAGSQQTHRVVLGFNEIGMWAEATGRAELRPARRSPGTPV